MTQSKLIGLWKMVSLQFEFADTHECVDTYGPKPHGYLIITQDRRMMTIITSDGRERPNGETDEAALFKNMMAYSGNFRLEGEDQFITTVDIAWHPAWIGSEQARFFTMNGDALSIVTAEITHPRYPGRTGRGVVKWLRADTRPPP
jgi:hypothetical protein